MATIREMPIPCDLSVSSFENACGMLGEMPRDVLLICPATQSGQAQAVQQVTGCEVVMIPVDMLKTPFTWGANHRTDWAWSPGV
jgi:hypothetical protein